jgi:NUMOD3 motif
MLENKYTSYYFNIVNNAKIRKTRGYYETHHIVPRSLGGTNHKENLVNLTAREHFICHLLLTKMYEGAARNKMIHAAWAMATLENPNQQRYKITSKIYESLRIKYASLKSITLKGKPGRKHSEETKKKLSLAHTGKKRKPMSEESKRKLSESMKGKNVGKRRTEEQKLAMSNKLKGREGKPLSEETKNKIKIARAKQVIPPRSEEHKKAISLAHKGKPKSKEQVAKQRQSLLRYYENKKQLDK